MIDFSLIFLYALLFCLGAVLSYVVLRITIINRVNTSNNQKELQISVITSEKSGLLNEIKELKLRNENDSQELKAEVNLLRSTVESKVIELTERKSEIEMLRQLKSESESGRKAMLMEFENLANKILKENTIGLGEINQKSVNELISPLKEKLEKFEQKVEETYRNTLKDQVDLRSELKKLFDLNQSLGIEAGKLTTALRSDSKQQGTWGEIVLERVLERSGLEENREYYAQPSVTDHDGKTVRPDIIVLLPGKKAVIIDSKVSLTAFEQYMNATDDKLAAEFIKRHVLSIRTHIQELAAKKYQFVQQSVTPEFVLMFVPVEAALSAAFREDAELFLYGWDRHVVVVSPSTLLATLRTVASVWKQEKQTRNVLEIARIGGTMHDKLADIAAVIEQLGKRIDGVKNLQEDALRKLTGGRGNLLSQADRMKKLGAKSAKEIDLSYDAETDDNE
jgi:DNA recombination protein RmuC